ncbi:MAG: ATP-binding protein [Caulobacterales bacterium]
MAIGAGLVALTVLPWRACAMWTIISLAIELWGWFASRDQFMGRPVRRSDQLIYLVNLLGLIANWFLLALLFWRTGRMDGAICAAIIWLSIIGFAQTFASRTPLGFAVCGVAPALGVLAVALATPQSASMQRSPILWIMTLAFGFALAGARQTFRAGKRLDETQARLRDSEAQYRVLADNVSDLIGRTSVDGELFYISPSVEAALGYTPQEFAAVDGLTHVHPDDRPLVEAQIRALLEAGGVSTAEYRMLRKDGAPTWVETSFSLVVDPGTNAPSEIVCLSRDINRRKALEADLVDARERAESAAAAKADFLANMTHELRTPLNAIIGFSGVLRDSSDLTAKDARHAGLINEASATLLVVVNGVLDFSKLDSGAFEFEAQPFEAIAMAQSMGSLVEDQASARGLTLNIRAVGGTDALEGDGPRLRQVLLNLLSNAIKFTAAGGVDVLVEQTPVLGGVQRLRIEVSDTGIGIAEDKLDAVFERFSQADASVSRQFGGTGLGLAICKRIIELMGGRIGARSQVGQGSTFWFELDLPIARERPEVVVGAVPAELERPLRLLLVEDLDVNRELVRAILEPFDIEVDTAVDGAEAVHAVSRSAYDIVLMDVQMPVMDGLAATRRIRALDDPCVSGLPIIAMTANVLPDQIQRCLDAGMNGHLGKPINPGRLLETLTSWTTSQGEVEEPLRSGA